METFRSGTCVSDVPSAWKESMNKTQKYTFLGTLILILAAFGLWSATGFHFLTKSEIPVEQMDELFGTKTIVWEKAFIVGLDIIGPVVVFLLAVGALSMYFARNRHR